MRNTIKAICIIIGTIIGAGFASGKEIYYFFIQKGYYGIVGLILSSILIGIIIYKVLIHIQKEDIKSYDKYLEKLNIHPKIREIINCIVNLFLLISFYIMVAGFCTYFEQELQIQKIIMAILVCNFCYLTLKGNIESISKLNTILIPVLILMICLIGIKTNIPNAIEKIGENKETGWLIASLEYVSYNSIILVPILISIKKYTYKKEKKIAIISSSIFLLLAIILYMILVKGGVNLNTVELPLIYMVNNLGGIYPYICGIIMTAAIYTSAISAGYSFLKNTSKNEKAYKKICFAICITAIPISEIGFSSLIKLLYPVFGVLGLIQIIYILKNDCKHIKEKY